MGSDRALRQRVQKDWHLDVLFVHEQQRVVIQLDLDALHIVVFDALQVPFLSVLWSKISQSWRVKGHFVLEEKAFDEGVIPLAVQSGLEDGKHVESLNLQNDLSNRVGVILEQVDIYSSLYLLKDRIRELQIIVSLGHLFTDKSVQPEVVQRFCLPLHHLYLVCHHLLPLISRQSDKQARSPSVDAIFRILHNKACLRGIEFTDLDIDGLPRAVLEEIIGLGIDADLGLVLGELIGDLNVPEILGELLDPMVIVEEEFQRQIIISEDDWIKMAQMVPREVDSYLAVDKVHLLQVLASDFIVCFHTLRLQNESRVPFSDILVDHQHLQVRSQMI